MRIPKRITRVFQFICVLVKDKAGKSRVVDTKCYRLPDDHIDVFNVFISAV